MNIYVRRCSGALLPIEVAANSVVADIERDLWSITPHPILLYRGEKITNSNLPLADLGLCSDEVLDLQEVPAALMLYNDSPQGLDLMILDLNREIVHNIQVIDGDITLYTHELQEDKGSQSYRYGYDGMEITIIFCDDDKIIECVRMNNNFDVTHELTRTEEITLYTEEMEILRDIISTYPQFVFKTSRD